jgi:Ca2+-binding RTX toxin-like protein
MANVFGTDNPETIDFSDGVTNSSDVIFGFGGDDTIFGLGGNDEIKGGGGADAINGGSGVDTSNYSDSSVGVVVTLETGQGFGGTAEGDTLTSIENLTGSAHEDLLIGNAGANVLTGLEDDDSLKGGGGTDTLFGDSGADTLKGGGGADRLFGGSGIDTATYVDSDAAVLVFLTTGMGAGGDAEGDTYSAIENVTGSDHHDTLWGNDVGNVLHGGEGQDSLKGFGGADTLDGQDHNDFLHGGDGIDILRGGDGNDTLTGGANGDTIQGEAGIDTLSYAGSSAGVVINIAAATAAGGHAAGDTYSSVENLNGSSHADSLFGDHLANVITGAGGDDFLFGQAGGDTFAFNEEFGDDTILDFAVGSDEIRFNTAVFANFAAVMASSAQVGSDVVITHSAGNTITLDNVLLGSLGAGDFVFVV